jgi:hypothetical protein
MPRRFEKIAWLLSQRGFGDARIRNPRRQLRTAVPRGDCVTTGQDRYLLLVIPAY